MSEKWIRSEAVYGREGVEYLRKCKLAVLGLGGVGSYAAEAVLRSGVGHIDVFDCDAYELSNFNRQLYATDSSLGIKKVEAFRQRAEEVNGDVVIGCFDIKVGPESDIDFSKYDYVLDAVDDIEAKLYIASMAEKCGVRFISAMGAAKKRHPELLKISTIYRTKVCPLARIIRARAKKLGLKDFAVVYSEEPSIRAKITRSDNCSEDSAGSQLGSSVFVPAAMGLMMASKAINDLIDMR